MILAKLIVVIFSVEEILLTNLIWWIDWLIERLRNERLIEHLEIQSKMSAVYLIIEKMRIAVWLIESPKVAVWLIEITMIAVWLTREIVVWLTEMRIVVWLTIFLCSEIELIIEVIVLEMMILIFVIQIVIVSVINNL
jgi:hypothetical protein